MASTHRRRRTSCINQRQSLRVSPSPPAAAPRRSDPKGETRVYLSLNDPGTSYKSFRDTMLATGKLVPLSGLAV